MAAESEWVLVGHLGKGTFGQVSHFMNKVTNQHIALKQMRFTPEQRKTKTYKRWTTEIEIMKKLDHENVVRGLKVPAQLDVPASEVPLLAMEYCQGGDLRKQLISPENSCGCSEFVIRSVCEDISEGIQFLHRNNVIHRDIKPENIVLHKTANDKVVYKLIDLGYAKDLEESSIMNSFVGTYEYLAPELLLEREKAYTNTVDYWCFGTVVFELVTGYRPFLPDMVASQRLKHLKQKQNDDIHLYMEKGGVIMARKSISKPNNISRIFRHNLERFLRLLLMFNPKARGGVCQKDAPPQCFLLLKSILSCKVVNVFSVHTNQMLSYPLESDDKPIHPLQLSLENETKIKLNEQLILLPSGQCPSSNDPAADLYIKPSEKSTHVYLYWKANNRTPRPGWRHPYRSELIKDFLDSEKKIEIMQQDASGNVSFSFVKKAWSQVMWYCRQLEKEYNYLWGADRALQYYLIRQNQQWKQLEQKLMVEIDSLKAEKEFFLISYQHDVNKYTEQMNAGIKAPAMYKNWQEMAKDVEQIDILVQEVEKISGVSRVFQDAFMKSSKQPQEHMKKAEGLQNMADQGAELYRSFKKALTAIPEDPKTKVRELEVQMKKLITEMFDLYIKLADELLVRNLEIMKQLDQIKMFIPKMGAFLEKCKNYKVTLINYQKRRQDYIWTLLKLVLKQHTASSNGSVSSLSSDTKSGSDHDNDSTSRGPVYLLPSVGTVSTNSNASSNQAASEIIDNAAESNDVIEENKHHSILLQDMERSMSIDAEESEKVLNSINW